MVSRSPVASSNPRRSAAPLPWLGSWRNVRTVSSPVDQVLDGGHAAVGRAVVHDHDLPLAPAAPRRAGASSATRRVAASLYTGITMVRDVGRHGGAPGSVGRGGAAKGVPCRPGRLAYGGRSSGRSPRPRPSDALEASHRHRQPGQARRPRGRGRPPPVHLLAWRDLATSRPAVPRCTPPRSPAAGPRPASRSRCGPPTPRATPRRACGTATGSSAGPAATWCSPGRRWPRPPAATAPATAWSRSGTACRSSRPLWAAGPRMVFAPPRPRRHVEDGPAAEPGRRSAT